MSYTFTTDDYACMATGMSIPRLEEHLMALTRLPCPTEEEVEIRYEFWAVYAHRVGDGRCESFQKFAESGRPK